MNNSAPYDFQGNGKLLFKPGAGMDIASNSTVKLTMVTAEGCDQMWKGIAVNQGGTLEMSLMSKIQDAQFALDIHKGATVSVSNSAFLNNNFAIYTNSTGAGNYNISLRSNKYGATTAGLKPAYLNQTPAPLDKGFAGIYVEGAGTIGIASQFNQPNQFYNLKYGIISKNTDIVVRNTTFSDITNVAPGPGYGASMPSFPNYRLGPLDNPGVPCTATVRVNPPLPGLLAGVAVYPNPAEDQVIFSWGGVVTGEKRLLLYNALGQTMRDLRLSAGSAAYTLGVGDLQAGVYFWELWSTGGERMGAGKVVKR